MKTKMADRTKVRANSLTIPLTDSEKEKIRQMADKKGLTMSSFIRSVINEIVARG